MNAISYSFNVSNKNKKAISSLNVMRKILKSSVVQHDAEFVSVPMQKCCVVNKTAGPPQVFFRRLCQSLSLASVYSVRSWWRNRQFLQHPRQPLYAMYFNKPFNIGMRHVVWQCIVGLYDLRICLNWLKVAPKCLTISAAFIRLNIRLTTLLKNTYRGSPDPRTAGLGF